MKIKYVGKKKKDITIRANSQNGLTNSYFFALDTGHIAEVEDPQDARLLLKDIIFEQVGGKPMIEPEEEGAQGTEATGTKLPFEPPTGSFASAASYSEEGEDGVAPDVIVKTREELVEGLVTSLANMEKIDILAFISNDQLYNGFKCDTRMGKERLLGSIKNFLMEKKELGV